MYTSQDVVGALGIERTLLLPTKDLVVAGGA